ncbi:hypothetical protein SYNPS1DRAFT_6561, partial [Syncephalis pseudoplumigaleata]
AAYNSQLEALSKQGKVLDFWKLVADLETKDIQPDATTWNLMIARRSISGEWAKAYELLERMRASGHKPTMATYYEMLRAILRNMHRDNVAVGTSAYDLIINGRSRLEPEHALRTLMEMKARGMQPLPTTYTAVIKAFNNLGDSQTVMKVLRDAEREGSVSISAYVTAFEACVDDDNMEGALYCWNYFMRSGIHVHEGNCLSLLRLAANAGNGSLAGDILRHLTQQKYRCTAIHFEPLFTALVNSDDVAAFGVLDLMERSGIPVTQPFVMAWTNRLSVSTAMLDKGFDLLKRIHREGGEEGGRKVHVALFNSLLIASIRLHDPERVASFFQQADELGVVPNTDSYNALLDACKIVQQPAMAVDLLQEMRDNNVPVTRATYERLIGAFCGVPAGESYEEAFQYLEEAKAAGYVPTESMYVMIVRKCARERDPRANIAMEEMEAFGYTAG